MSFMGNNQSKRDVAPGNAALITLHNVHTLLDSLYNLFFLSIAQAKLLEEEMTRADIIASKEQAILQAQNAKEAMRIMETEAGKHK
jgi:precorrin-4 methylase